jgi:hypothetical protein
MNFIKMLLLVNCTTPVSNEGWDHTPVVETRCSLQLYSPLAENHKANTSEISCDNMNWK